MNGQKIRNVFQSLFKKHDTVSQVKEDLIKFGGTYYWNGDKNRSVGQDFFDESYDSTKHPILVSPEEFYQKHIFKFVEYAKELGATILIVSPPLVKNISKPFAAPPKSYIELIAKYSIVYLSDQVIFSCYNSNLFFDRGHMNFAGAKLFTRNLAKEFVKSKLFEGLKQRHR